MKSLYPILLSIIFITCQPAEKQPAGRTGGQPDVLPAQIEENDVEARLQELGIELPEVGTPVANFVLAVKSGNQVFCSGNGPMKPDGTWYTGRVGDNLTIEQGYEAARLTAIQQLAVLKAELGDLNKVKRIVKVLGMVNAHPDFTDHPKVINGFSDLMVEVFGEKGKHARAAVGMSSLPFGIACEIEMIVEVED